MNIISFPTRVGIFIKRAREEVGITQQELSQRTGLSRVTINHLENGLRKQVKPEVIQKISAALGKNENYFLGVDDTIFSDLPISLSDAISEIIDLPKAEQEEIGYILKKMLTWRNQ